MNHAREYPLFSGIRALLRTGRGSRSTWLAMVNLLGSEVALPNPMGKGGLFHLLFLLLWLHLHISSLLTPRSTSIESPDGSAAAHSQVAASVISELVSFSRYHCFNN